MRTRWIVAACAAMAFATTGAADIPSMADAVQVSADTLPLPLAREVARQAIELVETKGVYPRRQDEYDQAKAALLAEVDGHADLVDRQALHGRIKALLQTLDADGHSFITAPTRRRQLPAYVNMDDLHPPAFKLVATSHGTVLRWVPPAITLSMQQGGGDYLKRFYDEAAARSDIKDACALVVDLTEQTGGNAWPPFVAMYPLFGDGNTARWVDRDGKRIPFVNRASLESMAGAASGGRANPLAPYAVGPLAVVVGKRTASAGEMLLVALLGEARVQTFGQPSYGLSTANKTYPLPDGSTLVLTGMRYALGDGPLYHGAIAPMNAVDEHGSSDSAVKLAAEWAAANSPRCQAAQPAVATASRRDQ